MVERTESIENALVERLDAAFTAAIMTKNEREVLSCLQTYYNCSKTQNALTVIHSELVQDSVRRIMQQDRMDAQGAAGKYEGLHNVYEELLRFMRSDLKFIIDGAKSSALTSRADQPLDVLAESVWPEVRTDETSNRISICLLLFVSVYKSRSCTAGVCAAAKNWQSDDLQDV